MRASRRFARTWGNSKESKKALHADVKAQHTVPFQQECEAIYWGSKRVTGLNAILYSVLPRFQSGGIFRGDVEGDRFYWGDLCQTSVKFLRNFITWGINTLKACPFMPYFDPKRPYVNYWFASSEGASLKSFNQCLSEKNQDRLEEEGGACIMYTFLGNLRWIPSVGQD